MATLCAPGAAHGATAAEAIANLNAQRAAHGLPAGIVERPDWSRGCALHNEYQRLNGGRLTHYEERDKPGYTEEGAAAGASSVLSSGDNWNSANPWETAPIHLHQILAPQLAETGVDDSEGFVCAYTWPGMTRPSPGAITVYSYPGDGTRHRASEVAAESPFTPGEKVGIPSGTETGPYLYVFVDGPPGRFGDARIDAATLTGPDGPVEVRTVDNGTPEVGGYLPPGGEVIPVAPLRALSSYTASVSGTIDGAPFSRTWSFDTIGKDPESSLEVNRSRAYFYSSSIAPARLTATSQSGAEVDVGEVAREASAPLSLPPGRWTVCANQPAAGQYEGWSGCTDVVVRGEPRLTFSGRPQVTRARLSWTLGADPVLDGRTATVTTRRLVRRCAGRGRGCSFVRRGPARVSKRTLRISQVVRARLPRRGEGVTVTVRVSGFELDGVPYEAASSTRTYKRRR